MILAAMSQLQDYDDHDDEDDHHNGDDEQQQQQPQPLNIASSSTVITKPVPVCDVIMFLQLVVLGELRMSTRMAVCLPACRS
jgi:hypothetical protein